MNLKAALTTVRERRTMITMASKKTSAKKTSTRKTSTATTLDPKVAKIDELILKSARGGGVASGARTALQAFSDDVVAPRLVLAAKSADPKVRAAAVEGGTVTPRRRELFPLAAITACLGDVEPKVRLAALIALNRGWGPKSEPVYASKKSAIKPALEPCLKDDEKTVANQAAVLWKRLGL